MSKIGLESIKEVLEPLGWKVISDTYTNLDTEMIFQCPEGHNVYTSWKKLRNKIICPTCEKNTFKAAGGQILPKSAGVTRTIALDQATHKTGFAVFDDKKLVSYGVFECTKNSEIERISEIKNWFQNLIINWKPDVVGIEGIQFQEEAEGRKMGVTVFETLARLQGVLMVVCYENDIRFHLCPTNTWRHGVGVKGKTRTDKKRSMQLLVKEWYDITVPDDIADAIGIGYYICTKINTNFEIQNWEI